MQTWHGGALAASLVLCMAGCGGSSTPSGHEQQEQREKSAVANTGKLTLRFKDWT
jgi:hypothetical protein